jgi:hypothetical protein
MFDMFDILQEVLTPGVPGVLGVGWKVTFVWPGTCTGTGIGVPTMTLGLTTVTAPGMTLGVTGFVITDWCEGKAG